MLVIKHVFIVVEAEISDASADKFSAFDMGESLTLVDGFHLLRNVTQSL